MAGGLYTRIWELLVVQDSKYQIELHACGPVLHVEARSLVSFQSVNSEKP